MYDTWGMNRKWEVNTGYSLVTNQGEVKMGDYKFVNLIFVVNVGSLYHDKRRVILYFLCAYSLFDKDLFPKHVKLTKSALMQ